MESKRESVTLPGRLVGMSREVDCSVRAVKVSIQGTAEYTYTLPVIFDTPSDLPDGFYSITFGGGTERVQRKFGAWVAHVA